VKETLDRAERLNSLKQNVRPADVVLGELEGITKRVIDVSLRSKVHDCINAFFSQCMRNEI
jgi:hypothetical protein